jgi:hypothetical protein
VGFAGDVELMQESAAAMGLAMILAIVIHRARVQFESFLQPFIIMLSLPLALVSALCCWYEEEPRHAGDDRRGDDGPCHEDAILLVDANQLRRDGLPEGRAAQGRPGAAQAHRDDHGHDDPRHAAISGRHGRRQRFEHFDCDNWRLITSTLLTLVVVPGRHAARRRGGARAGVAAGADARGLRARRGFGRADPIARWRVLSVASAFAQDRPQANRDRPELTIERAWSWRVERRPEGRRSGCAKESQ